MTSIGWRRDAVIRTVLRLGGRELVMFDFPGTGAQTRLRPVTDEVNRRIGHPPGHLGYTAQLAAVSGYSTLPGLPFVSAPTLILAGDDDPIIPTPNQKLLARFIRNSRLHAVPGAGHLLLVDSPEFTAPLITDFLDAPVDAVA